MKKLTFSDYRQVKLDLIGKRFFWDELTADEQQAYIDGAGEYGYRGAAEGVGAPVKILDKIKIYFLTTQGIDVPTSAILKGGLELLWRSIENSRP